MEPLLRFSPVTFSVTLTIITQAQRPHQPQPPELTASPTATGTDESRPRIALQGSPPEEGSPHSIPLACGFAASLGPSTYAHGYMHNRGKRKPASWSPTHDFLMSVTPGLQRCITGAPETVRQRQDMCAWELSSADYLILVLANECCQCYASTLLASPRTRRA